MSVILEPDAVFRVRLLFEISRFNDLDSFAVPRATGEALDEIGRHYGIFRHQNNINATLGLPGRWNIGDIVFLARPAPLHPEYPQVDLSPFIGSAVEVVRLRGALYHVRVIPRGPEFWASEEMLEEPTNVTPPRQRQARGDLHHHQLFGYSNDGDGRRRS